jgi:hypothetical protein
MMELVPRFGLVNSRFLRRTSSRRFLALENGSPAGSDCCCIVGLVHSRLSCGRGSNSQMTTRREFFQLAAHSATAAMLVGSQVPAAEQKQAHRVIPRRGRPLLDLQQRPTLFYFTMCWWKFATRLPSRKSKASPWMK